jgi:hypothetical protein
MLSSRNSPEADGTQPVHGVVAEVRPGGNFTLDEPVLGQLDGIGALA